MEPASQRLFEYPHCPLRRRAHALADRLPVIRPLAGMVWPAARRADRVELAADGVRARALAGFVRIGWDEVTVVRRSRTFTGSVSVAVEARWPRRRIEVVESLPGFEQLVRALREHTGVGEVVDLAAHRAA